MTIMKRKVSIRIGLIKVEAEFIDNATSDAIWRALPLESVVNRWGEEIYFSIPVTLGLENGQELVSSSDIAYWPPGKAFCIFFGATPASVGKEIRPASEVNVFGKVTGDIEALRHVSDGERIFVEKNGVESAISANEL